MEKVKFGIEVIVLLLAFPVWFVAEMKQVDKENKKNHNYNVEGIEDKKVSVADKLKDVTILEFTAMPFSKFMTINN